jgi:hypothetical protein
LHINASLLNKIEEFKLICAKLSPDFFCVPETWINFDLNDIEITIENYDLKAE